MAATPDPFTSQDTRNAMARRSAYNPASDPIHLSGVRKFASDAGGAIANQFTDPQSYINRSGAVLGDLVTGRLDNYADIPASASGDYTHNAIFGDGKPSPPTTSTPVSVATSNANSAPKASPPASTGMTRLAPGVMRSSVPGVYTARMKDGSVGFSNVIGDDGQPSFGPTATQLAAERKAAGMTGDTSNFAGTQVDPRSQYFDPNTGMTSGPGVGAFTPDAQAGQVDPTGLQRRGIVAAQNSGYTLPKVGGFSQGDIGEIIDNATDPYQLQASAASVEKAIADDPNRDNPEVKAAGNVAMRRLSQAMYDKRSQFYGNNGAQTMAAMSGMPPVPGMGGGAGGGGGSVGHGGNPITSYADFIKARADAQRADADTAKAQAEAANNALATDEAHRANIAKEFTDADKQRAEAMGISPDELALYHQLSAGNFSSAAAAKAAHAKFQSFLQNALAEGMQDSRGWGQKLDYLTGTGQKIAPTPLDTPPGEYRLRRNGAGNLTLVSPTGGNSTLSGYGAGGFWGHVNAALGGDNYSPKLMALFNDPAMRELLLNNIPTSENEGMSRKTAGQ